MKSLSMDLPSIYTAYNGISTTDAIYAIDNYLKLIRWNKDGADIIMDVGCGPGDILTERLIPAIPKNVKKIVAVDISTTMLDYAETHYHHPMVSYEEMDIGAEDVPADFKEKFDHVVSFYCLHWIQDQRKALSNILKMLKPGGDVLITSLKSTPLFDIYEPLYRQRRWEPYMENFETCISPYQRSKNAEYEFTEILEEVGFNVHMCNVERRTYVYPTWDNLITSIMGVNPFYSSIPDHLKDDYRLDCAKEFKEMNLFGDAEKNLVFPYSSFFIYASKK